MSLNSQEIDQDHQPINAESESHSEGSKIQSDFIDSVDEISSNEQNIENDNDGKESESESESESQLQLPLAVSNSEEVDGDPDFEQALLRNNDTKELIYLAIVLNELLSMKSMCQKNALQLNSTEGKHKGLMASPNSTEDTNESNNVSRMVGENTGDEILATIKMMIGMNTQNNTVNAVNAADEFSSLYSRQLCALGGLDAMSRITKSNILISGLNGLGIEIAKNIILAGVKSVTLHDKQNCTMNDLASQFCLSDANIGQNRAEASCNKLAELNSYVNTTSYIGDLTEEYLKQFNVIVLVNASYTEQHRIAKFAHANGIAIIITENRGLFCKVFCDFGENFTIYDPDGVQPTSTMIANIKRNVQGLVTCLEETTHGLNDGDFVTFTGVYGMTELNGCAPIKINVLGPNIFSIGDTRQFSLYKGGGIATEVKMPKIMHFKCLEDSEKCPEFVISDFQKFNRVQTLHVAFRALHQYIKDKGRMPRPWNKIDAEEFFSLCKTLDGNILKEVVLIFAKICAGSTCPLDATMGGFVGQEVLKACSGIFTPVHQWMYYDAIECLPDTEIDEADAAPLSSRYDAQIAIFGRRFQEKLSGIKYLIVGAGGVGCELLKNFVMIGAGTRNGELFITDMDVVEKSNLSRSFLFRPKDIEQPKARTAAAAIKSINPDIKVSAYNLRMGSDNEEIFSEDFFAQLNGITNAVDNLETRIHMDRECVMNRVPLVDSSTYNARGLIQVNVPFLTESHDSLNIPREKGLLNSMINNFPSTNEHMVQWAKDLFDDLFTTMPGLALLYLKDPHYFERALKLSGFQNLPTIKNVIVKAFIEQRPKCFNDCIIWARQYFDAEYIDEIKRLLRRFPANRKTKMNYNPFCYRRRRRPKPLRFNVENETHLDFVYTTANLMADVYGINQVPNKMYVAFILNELHLNSSKTTSESNYNDCADMMSDDSGDGNWNPFGNLNRSCITIKPLHFEKDNDSNFHRDFIVAASNLRAAVHQMPRIDYYKAMSVVDKIVPAIVTTSSFVAGWMLLEVIKLLMDHKECAKYKNGFINLARPPLLTIDGPLPAVKSKYYDKEWTLWDRFDVLGDMTLQEFLHYFEEKEKLKITMISHGISVLYSASMPHCKKRMPLFLTDILCRLSKKPIEPHVSSLKFDITCQNDQLENIPVPYVHYILPVKENNSLRPPK